MQEKYITTIKEFNEILYNTQTLPYWMADEEHNIEHVYYNIGVKYIDNKNISGMTEIEKKTAYDLNKMRVLTKIKDKGRSDLIKFELVAIGISSLIVILIIYLFNILL